MSDEFKQVSKMSKTIRPTSLFIVSICCTYAKEANLPLFELNHDHLCWHDFLKFPKFQIEALNSTTTRTLILDWAWIKTSIKSFYLFTFKFKLGTPKVQPPWFLDWAWIKTSIKSFYCNHVRSCGHDCSP